MPDWLNGVFCVGRCSSSILFLAILSLLWAVSSPLSANETTATDLAIGIRTIRFLRVPPQGKIEVAVIFDGENKTSTDDARSILAWLDANKAIIGVELVGKLVEIRNLDKLPPCAVAIVAANTNIQFFDSIHDFARHNGALILSADLACVQAGKCTIGVTSTPSVEIIVSYQLMKDSGIQFRQGFLMMVKGAD